MLIISKNKDYYDGVVGSMGVDKTIVYERNTTEINDIKKFPKPFDNKKRKWSDVNHFYELPFFKLKSDTKYEYRSPFIIGFCGKLYVGIKFYYKVRIHNSMEIYDYQYDTFYDLINIKKYVEENHWNNVFNDTYNYINDYDPIEIHREIKSPIFIFDFNVGKQSRINEKFIINPILKDYEFYKIFDTFTAFQEIQMFVSGVLGTNEKETIEVDDKYKIGQHGFDKWSFRKEPTKNKK